MTNIEEVLKKNYAEWRNNPTVISISFNSTKFSKELNTGRPCITIFVRRKITDEKGIKRLKASGNFIESEVDGVEIDIVELSTPDYEIGETPISRLSPFLQRKIAGGLVRE